MISAARFFRIMKQLSPNSIKTFANGQIVAGRAKTGTPRAVGI